jgi:uncharacterized membrane protein
MMASIARGFIGIALVAFGIQHLVHRAFVTRLVPKLPAWIPWHPFWACLVGVVLIAIGAAIVCGKQARWAGFLLSAIGLLSVVLLYLPRLAATPHNPGLWTTAGKALALAGAGLLGTISPVCSISSMQRLSRGWCRHGFRGISSGRILRASR